MGLNKRKFPAPDVRLRDLQSRQAKPSEGCPKCCLTPQCADRRTATRTGPIPPTTPAPRRNGRPGRTATPTTPTPTSPTTATRRATSRSASEPASPRPPGPSHPGPAARAGGGHRSPPCPHLWLSRVGGRVGLLCLLPLPRPATGTVCPHPRG